jgi:hypothetical protein
MVPLRAALEPVILLKRGSVMMILRTVVVSLAVGMGIAGAVGVAQAQAIDDSSIGKPDFRKHTATYGLVYRLPQDVTDVLDATVNGPLREKLMMLGLKTEVDTFNIPHVTVVHVHNADPATPKTMLDAFPAATSMTDPSSRLMR